MSPLRVEDKKPVRRLNLGCGRSPIADWINVDTVNLPGVDLVRDLERDPLPYDDSSVDEFHASHFLEHIARPLPLMQELHRVAKPGALATFRVPYGSSDDADEDPTHVRRYFIGSWGYFGQPYYWRADYGYRGDWEIEETILVAPILTVNGGHNWLTRLMRERNVVEEMIVLLRAKKPIRPPSRELQEVPPIRVVSYYP
jgi:SAM-dependent methyltransferase